MINKIFVIRTITMSTDITFWALCKFNRGGTNYTIVMLSKIICWDQVLFVWDIIGGRLPRQNRTKTILLCNKDRIKDWRWSGRILGWDNSQDKDWVDISQFSDTSHHQVNQYIGHFWVDRLKEQGLDIEYSCCWGGLTSITSMFLGLTSRD